MTRQYRFGIYDPLDDAVEIDFIGEPFGDRGDPDIVATFRELVRVSGEYEGIAVGVFPANLASATT